MPPHSPMRSRPWSPTRACRRSLRRGRGRSAPRCRHGMLRPRTWRGRSTAAVGEFSAEWLALREPADHAARAERLAGDVADAVGGGDVLRVLDLGSGTGSNLRYLAPRLPRPQQWILVDRDAELLAAARRGVPHGIDADVRQLDLRDLEGEDVRSSLEGRALVTASALLDFVSAAWLDALADLCAGAGAAALFALSYDGLI